MKRLPGFQFAAVIGAGCILVLGACVPLHSTSPLYSEADAEGAPALRDGLWLALAPTMGPCEFDTEAPAANWPPCASKMVIRDGVWHTGQASVFGERETVETEWDAQPFILAAGEPRVLQMADDEGGSNHWIYTLITPTGVEEEGILAFDLAGYFCMVEIENAIGPGLDLSGLENLDLFAAEGAENCLIEDRANLASQSGELLAEVARGVAADALPELEAGDKVAFPISFEWVRTPTEADKTP